MQQFALKAVSLAVLFASSTSVALAGGFQLTEQSSLALGRSYAGMGVDGTDLSGTFYNPASMTLHSGLQIQAGGVGVGLNLPYKSDTDASHDQNGRKKPEFVPFLYVTKQLTDRLWTGLSFTVPFGLSTEYDAHWDQADRGYRASIKVVDLNPNLAFKVTDTFSIGGGVSLQYVKAKLGFTVAGADFDAQQENFAWGWNIGAMWSPLENVRVGLSYRSAVTHKTDGDLKVMGKTYDSYITMDAPSYFILSAAWDINPTWSVYASARKTDWSSFTDLTLDSPVVRALQQKMFLAKGYPASMMPNFSTSRSIKTEWRDTYLYTVGADYRLNPTWTLRAGFGYERSPISQPELRSGTIPDADRWWFSVGASYHFSEAFQADFGLAHLHGVHERGIYNDQGKKIGEFERLDAYLFGLQAQYRF